MRGASFLLVTLLLAPAAALAQDAATSDVEVQLYRPALGAGAYLTVSSARPAGEGYLELGLSVTYLTGPLTVAPVDPNTMEVVPGPQAEVVQSGVASHLYGSYGVTRRLQLGAVLPVMFSLSGDGLDPDTAGPADDGLDVAGLGDVYLEAAYAFHDRRGFRAAAILGATAPTSTSFTDDSGWLGEDLPSARPMLAAELVIGRRVELAANLGAIVRKSQRVFGTDIGQQLSYGAAARYLVNPRVSFLGEVFGRVGTGDGVNDSPLEADGAVRVKVTRQFTALAGAGGGLTPGIGSPDFRLFAALSWTSDRGDGDGDGVPNQSDRCPDEAEDLDGWDDSDGCFDGDNDLDYVMDDVDQCPLIGEDKDGFEDDDGCPEEDNDKDGILDTDDRCPDHAEDRKPPFPSDGCPSDKQDSDDDGISDADDQCPFDFEDPDDFEDADGCPDEDNDQDGLLDDEDSCPDAAEDFDNFEDADGCPELDDDLDGFADSEDRCPRQREVVNGVEDFDGCPDSGGRVLVKRQGDRIELLRRLEFRRGKLRSASLAVMDQLAVLMRGQPDVDSWRLIVSTGQGTSDAARQAAQERADYLRQQLGIRGIRIERVEALGAVSDRETIVIVAGEKSAAHQPPPEPDVAPEADPADYEFEVEDR